MATYKSSYTGPQIDQAVGNALNKDTSTLSNDVNHIPASSVVKSAINTVDESIAIRVSGNKTTYASGAEIGQYVIVDKSTITGITDGLYKAAKAIPYNTAIDSTYLTAVSGGGLNDLKAAFDSCVSHDSKYIASGATESITVPVKTVLLAICRRNDAAYAALYMRPASWGGTITALVGNNNYVVTASNTSITITNNMVDGVEAYVIY